MKNLLFVIVAAGAIAFSGCAGNGAGAVSQQDLVDSLVAARTTVVADSMDKVCQERLKSKDFQAKVDSILKATK